MRVVASVCRLSVPCLCPFLDDIPLKFGQSAEDVEDRFPPEVVVSMFSWRDLKPIPR